MPYRGCFVPRCFINGGKNRLSQVTLDWKNHIQFAGRGIGMVLRFFNRLFEIGKSEKTNTESNSFVVWEPVDQHQHPNRRESFSVGQ